MAWPSCAASIHCATSACLVRRCRGGTALREESCLRSIVWLIALAIAAAAPGARADERAELEALRAEVRQERAALAQERAALAEQRERVDAALERLQSSEPPRAPLQPVSE